MLALFFLQVRETEHWNTQGVTQQHRAPSPRAGILRECLSASSLMQQDSKVCSSRDRKLWCNISFTFNHSLLSHIAEGCSLWFPCSIGKRRTAKDSLSMHHSQNNGLPWVLCCISTPACGSPHNTGYRIVPKCWRIICSQAHYTFWRFILLIHIRPQTSGHAAFLTFLYMKTDGR